MTGTTINGVEIPAITNISRSKSKSWEEIDLIGKDQNFVFQEPETTEDIQIDFVLNKTVHSQSKTLEAQIADVKSLRNNDPSNNTINYLDIDGHLQIESIDLPEEAGSNVLITGTISGYLIE